MTIVRSRVLAALVTLAAFGACSKDSPTGPSEDSHAPALGDYRVVYTFYMPTPWATLDQTDTVMVTVTTANADSITGSAKGSNVVDGPFSLGFWNHDAYLIYVKLNYSPTAQLRLRFHPDPTCNYGNGSGVRYNDGRRYSTVACTVERIKP